MSGKDHRGGAVVTHCNVYVPSVLETDLITSDSTIVERFIKVNSYRSDVVFVDDPHLADVVVLFERFSFKQKEYGRMLLSDEFLRRWASKTYVVNYDDSIGTGFLPGCYVSVSQSCFDPMWHRACAYPKTYNECITEKQIDEQVPPSILFSFRGSLGSNPIRSRHP